MSLSREEAEHGSERRPPMIAPRRRPRARRGWGGGLLRVFAWGSVATGLALGSLMMFAYALGFVKPPNTLAVVSAESERVVFEVASAQQATIPLDGFRIDDGGDLVGECARDALGPGWALEPQSGVEVIYELQTVRGPRLEQPLAVTIVNKPGREEAAVLRGAGADRQMQTRSFGGGELLLLEDRVCGPLTFRRLPIWGAGEIGGPPSFRADGQAPTLLSGEVEMYGRAQPLDIALPSWLGGATEEERRAQRAGFTPEDNTLYASLAGAFQVPPGSRISTLLSSADPGLKAMRGFASLDGDPPRRRFVVNVSTGSPELYFYPPGGGAEPDLLRMGLISQLSNDPNIQRAFQILVWFIVVLPIALELSRPLFERGGRD